MSKIVAKGQEVTTKVREHITAAEKFLAEDRPVNGHGVFIERWPVVASLESARIELTSAIETLSKAPAWPGPADYEDM